jgi:hypothetical protein
MYVCVCLCVCVCVCVFQYNSGTPRAILTKLGTHKTIYIYIYIYLYIIYIINILSIYIKMDVYMCLCMLQHKSGTPGAIWNELPTQMTLYIYYIIYTSWLPGVTRVFIFPNLLSDKHTYTHSSSIYNILKILIDTYSHMCTKFGWTRSRRSRVMSVWCYLSFYLPHQILHWPETHKFRYFTVMSHLKWAVHVPK